MTLLFLDGITVFPMFQSNRKRKDGVNHQQKGKSKEY